MGLDETIDTGEGSRPAERPGRTLEVQGDNLSGGESDARGEQERKGPWIRYRVEYRHRLTDELLHRYDTNDVYVDDDGGGHDENSHEDGPAFEVITTFKARTLVSKDPLHGEHVPVVAASAPSYHMHIYSQAIINALQSVVQYYPDQDLTGDTLVVRWPYPILVHHYKELAGFRDSCASKADSADLCVREKDAAEHLSLLLSFLDRHVIKDFAAEQERNARGFRTFEGLWLALKPGTSVLITTVESTDWQSYVVHSISGGIFENPPREWTVLYWKLKYNGTYLGRVEHRVEYSKFDGELDMRKHHKFVDMDTVGDEEKEDEVTTTLRKYGEIYWNLLHKQCKYYKGKTKNFPFNEVDGLVMADLKAYYAEGQWPKPLLMQRGDCRTWSSDCTCSVCKRRRVDKTNRSNVASLFEDYNFITPEAYSKLEPHQYLLCPSEMPAFVFRTRTWETLHVRHFEEPKFDEKMIDSLVMDPSRVRTLKALAKSFARVNKHGESLRKDPWAADFVKGKGNGLIFLLHGRPGVGKTCTAECISEFTKRPLMVLTCSDIGTDPEAVEKNLTRNFKTAKSWGAVLLIDEADVFMESRSSEDLTRNSLVAGFLRALEFYDGILFLTTNRVGSFDDAFVSRVHIQMYYPDFTDDQRQQVWKTFVDKLARERGDYIRLNIDAKKYLRGAEMRAVKWNGREIRNAFQTAVALAEYDADKDEEGKIVLTDSHLRSVVELSKDFKDYLNDLHKGDEGKRAERKYERLDSYEKEHNAK